MRCLSPSGGTAVFHNLEARAGDGVRVLVGAAVVPVTWFYTNMGLIVGRAPWLAEGPEPPAVGP